MSNPIEIGQEVLAAQGQILSYSARRYGLRAALVGGALLFMFFAAISLHAVLWALFLTVCGLAPIWASLCVLAFDLVGVLIFALFALNSRRPSMAEEKARIQREHCIQELKQSIAVTALVSLVCGPLGRFVGHRIFDMIRAFFTGNHAAGKHAAKSKGGRRK